MDLEASQRRLHPGHAFDLGAAVGAVREMEQDPFHLLGRELAVEPQFEEGPPSEGVQASHVHETHRRACRIPGVLLATLFAVPDSSTTELTQQQAFDKYVVPEIEVLYRVARSITRNPTDAEDLVQDTMLRAYKAILRFDGRHPRAWLLTIMRNAQINRVRRKRPELLRDPDAAMERLADESSEDEGPEGLVVETEFDAAVETAVNALPEKFRDVVELVDIQGLSYQEAADILGVPTGTIMSRLHRARTRIRKHLESSGAFVNGRPA